MLGYYLICVDVCFLLKFEDLDWVVGYLTSDVIYGSKEKRRCGDSMVGDGTGAGSIHRDEAGDDVAIAGMLGCKG